MSSDGFDDALEFSRDYQKALSAVPSALHDVLECVVCNSLLISPYTLRCGHTFCGNCLASWFNEQRSNHPSCPNCRDSVKAEPVPNLAIRQLAVAVIESWNADPENEPIRIPDTDNQLVRGEKLFPGLRQSEPLFDSEDGVYRCPACDHEIEDGECSGCGRHFSGLEDSEYDTDRRHWLHPFTGATDSSSDANIRRHLSSSHDEEDSYEIDSDDMNFVVNDDDPEVLGSESYNESDRDALSRGDDDHMAASSDNDGSDNDGSDNDDSDNDDSDNDDNMVTNVRQVRPSQRVFVIDDSD